MTLEAKKRAVATTETGEYKGPQFGMCYRGVFDIKPEKTSKLICVAVYTVMCGYGYGERGFPKICRLSQKRIAEILECCKTVVVYAIRELREQGYIRLVGKCKIGAVGAQYEIVPRYYSEDMSLSDSHMLQSPSGEPQGAMTYTTRVHQVNSNGSSGEHITENLQKINNKPTKEKKEVGCDVNSSNERNPKWVEAAEGVMRAFKSQCPSAVQPTLDEAYSAIELCKTACRKKNEFGSWTIKEAIGKCNQSTKSWKGVLYHLKIMLSKR